MSRIFVPPNPNSLVHQAIVAAGGIKALADQLDLSEQTISQWVKSDRISNRNILKVCHIADIPPLDLITYIERKKAPWTYTPAKRKPKTLDALVDLQRGEISEWEAFLETRLHPKVIRQVLTLWGDRLPLLRDTLYSDLPKSLQAARLGVTERQLNRLIHTYLPTVKKEPKPYLVARKRAQEKWGVRQEAAVRAIRGDTTIAGAARDISLSERQMHRWMDKMLRDRFELGFQYIKDLPKSLRNALANESLMSDHPEIAVHLVQFWKQHGLAQRPMPTPPETWLRETLRRCLIGLLTGEVTLKDLAESRKTPVSRLRPLLTGHLLPLSVSWDQVSTWPVAHQEALAEILNALEHQND